LSLDLEEINQLVLDMENDSKALKDELYKICWFMRGGVTISEAYNMDIDDRKIIGNIIESNLETTQKSGMPFF